MGTRRSVCLGPAEGEGADIYIWVGLADGPLEGGVVSGGLGLDRADWK